jgi:spore coat polysaccharide biosynthesis protein SpsF
MSVVAIIQARMGSTRLPGKVLSDLAGKPVLLRVLERVSAARTINNVVVAIPDTPENQRLEKFCAAAGYTCFKGSEQDVLDRYYRTAVAHRANVIVRITSDCPLIDPAVIDQVVETYLKCQSELKYVSNIHPTRTFPRGLDTEVMGIDTLEAAWRNDRMPEWREHVTPYIYRNPERFEIVGVTHPSDFSRYRLTVDTKEDLQLIELLFAWFQNRAFGWQEVIQLLRERPELTRINCAVEQKIVRAL